MKNFRKILKQVGQGIFTYSIPCLMGAYESYYRNADLFFTAQIAACVIFFVILSAIILGMKKEYDHRKHNGCIFLFISLGLMTQIALQGNLGIESRVLVCIVCYVTSITTGVIFCLLATKKLAIKNRIIKSIVNIVGLTVAFLLTFLCAIGRIFGGRRGTVLLKITGEQKNTAILWYCILLVTMIYAFVAALAMMDVVVAPNYYKKS
ncbi:hypothetical protein [Agathobacter sp.]